MAIPQLSNEIQTQHLSNMSLDCYCYANPVGHDDDHHHHHPEE
jgi:hypothetical protein